MREFQEMHGKGASIAVKNKGSEINMDEINEFHSKMRMAKLKSDIEDFIWFMSCFIAIMVFFWVIY